MISIGKKAFITAIIRPMICKITLTLTPDLFFKMKLNPKFEAAYRITIYSKLLFFVKKLIYTFYKFKI